MKRGMMKTINRSIRNLASRACAGMSSLSIVVMCATALAYQALAQQSAQQTFPSPEEASQGLLQALQSNNVQAVKSILGGAADLASCGDEAQDKAERELFVEKYHEMHRLGREAHGTMTLYVGAENWPFPVPLVEKNDAWRFDPNAGAKEVLFRRIGENELTAIMICHEFVTAEEQYRFKPNTANPAGGLPASLVVRAASRSTGGEPVLFQGYYFQVLARRPGNAHGFSLIAYPAEYRSSGVMTFIVTNNDVVYEKDLGANTSALASAMTTFRKDATWQAAEQ